ncbi:methylated-DNA--[protein]-cysteine S-methyltransferase [Kribbella sp. NBC_01245]|uniref:methylated-DNA--[protein]-cysteine S-methyltransferase n=1 Tax=Kribbella sp. NBC_01245 TaxID=2903578 RepID=UPI002E27BF10|nr:methylated-DNA--[protein]-cysteine S-methyltransferase [Kribbella sp. NBC_01245]
MRWTAIESPIGELSLAADDTGLTRLRFGAVGAEVDHDIAGESAVLTAARQELAAYFAGELTEFTVPLSAPGGSAFEVAVWRRLTAIPYGEMETYGEVARAVGDVGAARAVGVACNRNPVAIIVPCHRVVGAGGKMVGFGGGLPRKRHLLELEARVTLETAWS